jgi:hypothetical protein
MPLKKVHMLNIFVFTLCWGLLESEAIIPAAKFPGERIDIYAALHQQPTTAAPFGPVGQSKSAH